MEAGRLDRRIRIEYQGPAIDDGLRSKPGGWLKLCYRWAELVPLTGSERIAAGENAGFDTMKFRFRPPTREVTTVMRLIYGGKIHDIESVMPIGREGVEVMCCVRHDADPDTEDNGIN